ncbi:unnamed protein product [Parnassius apollo]|uniref:(apollo) hypothetical protein n=1 Tax=Parnassius apollo TaxID=110799 RepID=A0A8S3W6U5_PARAO|nr:unnamed protein product [Parnassius apollo]
MRIIFEFELTILIAAIIQGTYAKRQCLKQSGTDWEIELVIAHEDCNKFYKCFHGKPLEVICPKGLFFNMKYWQCDWKGNVNCSKRNIPVEDSADGDEITNNAETESEDIDDEEIDDENEQIKIRKAGLTFLKNYCPVNPMIQWRLPHEEDSPVAILFVAAALAAEDNGPCPKEQDVNFKVERLLPHNECNKFYQCIQGEPVEMFCADGLFFNSVFRYCDWAPNVDCGERTIPTGKMLATNQEEEHEPEPESDNPEAAEIDFLENGCPVDPVIHWLLPDDNDCSLFFYCVWGEKVQRSCPNSLHFNRKLQKYSHLRYLAAIYNRALELRIYSNVTMMKGIILLVSFLALFVIGYAANQCHKEQETNWQIELLLKHEDCDKFYKCTLGQPIEMHCPDGLYFNPEISQCDWKDNVDCSEKNMSHDNNLKSEGSDELGTDTEYQNESEEIDDASETVEDSDEEDTDFAGDKNSSQENLEVSELEFLENGCPVNPQIHWLLPHDDDCNLFYYCVLGEKVQRNCPSSLHFNKNLQVCDWPDEAGCSKSLEDNASIEHEIIKTVETVVDIKL